VCEPQKIDDENLSKRLMRQ